MKTSHRKKELQKLLDNATKGDDFSWNLEYIAFSMEMINEKQTYFEYAYEKKEYSYCDMCIQFWMEKILPKDKNRQELVDLLTLISQPPMNQIIQEPVFVMYMKSKSYDLSKVYDEWFVKKVLETNKTTVEIEEPSFGTPITYDEFDKLETGQSILTQMDSYDCPLMNSKFMTNGQVKQLLKNGKYRKSFEKVEDLFPVHGKRLRTNHTGIHFVENIENPLRCFNLEKYEHHLFYHLMHKTELSTKIKWDPSNGIITTYLDPELMDTGVKFGMQCEWEGIVLYVDFYIGYDSRKKNDDVALMTVFVGQEEFKETKMEHVGDYKLLLFVSGQQENGLTLLCDTIQNDYIHETERIVKRAVVKDKLVSAGEYWLEVTDESGTHIHNVFKHKQFDFPLLNDEIDAFKGVMKKQETDILFPDKSYALRCVRLGIFTIPMTVYAQHVMRLSNGKIPKKMKKLSEYTSKKNFIKKPKSYFMNKLQELRQFKVLISKYEVEVKKKTFENVDELKAVAIPLIEKNQLIKFYECMTGVDFALKNKFIMSLRKMELPYTFNELYMCIMNKQKCKQLMNKENMLTKWIEYFTQKGHTMPNVSTFEVEINELPVTDYIKSKMKDKLGTERISLTPLVLVILLKYDLQDDILQAGKNILLTDCNFYPIFFVYHFCDSAEKRLYYTKKLLLAECRTNVVKRENLHTALCKWTKDRTDNGIYSLLICLFEWPFDPLFQGMFFSTMLLKPNFFLRRNCCQYLSQLFAFIPGHGVLENQMLEYGYPKNNDYIESWHRGIEWFYDIGYSQNPVLQAHIVTLLKNKSTIDLEGMEEIKKVHLNYYLKQVHEFDRLNVFQTDSNRLLEISNEDLFLNKKLNIHYENFVYDPLAFHQSIFHQLVVKPHLWDHKKFQTIGEIMMFYLKNVPVMDQIFTSIGGYYIDIKLNQFSKIKVDPTLNLRHVRRKRMISLSYLTLLGRHGGSEKQMMFLMHLQNPCNPQFTYFSSVDVHNLLSNRTNNELFTSTFLKSHYHCPNSFPIVLENVYFLLTDISLFCCPDDKLQEIIDGKIERVVLFLNFYLKGFNYEDCSDSIITHFSQDKIHFSTQQMYLNAIEKIQVVLKDVAMKMYFLHRELELDLDLTDDFGAKELSKRFGSILFKILTNRFWESTYIADIRRFEPKHVSKGVPSLFSVVNILLSEHFDIGKIWWTNWHVDMLLQDELKNEMIRIFKCKKILIPHLARSIIHFCRHYITENITNNQLTTTYNRHISKTEKRDNYIFLGSCVIVFMQSIPNQIHLSFTENSPFTYMLDDVFYDIVVSMHRDQTMDHINSGQFLWFLDELYPGKYLKTPKLAFNKIVEFFIQFDLHKSMLIFLESFEKHFDYHQENQILDNFVKRSRTDHWKVNQYSSVFTLSVANSSYLAQKFTNSSNSILCPKPEPGTEKADIAETLKDLYHYGWMEVVTKMLFMGILDWGFFNSHLTVWGPFTSMVCNHYDFKDTFSAKSTSFLSYFTQKGINPFLLENIKCTDNKKITWRQHVMLGCRSRGWPMKLYFPPICEKSFQDEITIDDSYSVNDGIKYNNFQYFLREKTLSGSYGTLNKFVFEAQSIITVTLFNTNYDYGSKMTIDDLKISCAEFYKFIDDFENFACIKFKEDAFWPFKHGVIKCNDLVYQKIDLVSFAIIFCKDISPLKLTKMYTNFDMKIKTLEEKIDKMKVKPIKERMAFFSTYILNQLSSSFLYLLQFNDNIRLFDVAFKRLEHYTYLLNLQPTMLLLGAMVNVKTSYRLNGDELCWYSYDILTFAVYYGRSAHAKYLIDFLCKQISTSKGHFDLDSIKLRNHNHIMDKFHQETIINDACAYEHLLSSAIRKGHIKTFCHILHNLPNSKLEHIKWKYIIEACVHLVKMDASSYEDCLRVLRRKRIILVKILNSEKLSKFKLSFRTAVDFCCKYLTGYKQKIRKVKDYTSIFTPDYLIEKNYMRSELTILGDHIGECLDIFEKFCDEKLIFSGTAMLNLTLFYSKNLFNFVFDRLDPLMFEETVFNEQSKWVGITSQEEKLVDDLYKEKNFINKFKCLVVFQILQMETINKSLSIQEIIMSGYVEHCIERMLKNANRENKKNLIVFFKLLCSSKFFLTDLEDYISLLCMESLPESETGLQI